MNKGEDHYPVPFPRYRFILRDIQVRATQLAEELLEVGFNRVGYH